MQELLNRVRELSGSPKSDFKIVGANNTDVVWVAPDDMNLSRSVTITNNVVELYGGMPILSESTAKTRY